jgi:hypothetical protein
VERPLDLEKVHSCDWAPGCLPTALTTHIPKTLNPTWTSPNFLRSQNAINLRGKRAWSEQVRTCTNFARGRTKPAVAQCWFCNSRRLVDFQSTCYFVSLGSLNLEKAKHKQRGRTQDEFVYSQQREHTNDKDFLPKQNHLESSLSSTILFCFQLSEKLE